MGDVEVLADEARFGELLDSLAEQISKGGIDRKSAFVGIQRRGVTISERLASLLAARGSPRPRMGSVDITLYRDDLSLSLPQPVLHSTEIPFDVNGGRIIIIDDVLFTGRTARAALSAVLDFGRPAKVELAVLVDRGNRELPIQPDFVAFTVKTKTSDIVEVLIREVDGVDCVKLKRG